MFPFAGFNLYPYMNLVSLGFNGDFFLFAQHNTNYTYTYLSLSDHKSYFISLKIFGGLAGLGVEDSLVSLTFGGYTEDFFLLTTMNKNIFRINSLMSYQRFFGGANFSVLSIDGEMRTNLGFIGGYRWKDYDFGITFDSTIGVFGGYKWRFLYAFASFKFVEKFNINLALSTLFEPEYMKRETVRIEVPVYIQVPVIVRETLYVRQSQNYGGRKDTTNIQVDPKVVENLYLKGLEAYSKGKYAEALFFFQEVLKLDPNNKKALSAVERIRKILEGQ